MRPRVLVALLFSASYQVFVVAPLASASPTPAAAEYSKHLEALAKLSVAVAQAMPPEKYGFRPHPDSMDFGQLMSHIATTNYQFCAGLKDAEAPALPAPTDKPGVVKFLSDSFDYCAGVISNLSEDQLAKTHNSPDGNLPGREVLLAMYIHVAHHRGQAEIYLRDVGIKPPSYRI
ncbi:MAG TPA: DinB family protein [Candidatus Methylomirabilis sp.]|nr:DinB family protein [Candidatus Methylomirabilis sp.]